MKSLTSTVDVVAEPSLTTKILIKGYADTMYEYGKVKNTIVRIGKDFYFKHDDARIFKYKDKSGKARYYRVDSPLFTTTPNGTKLLKSEAILTEDGIFLDKNSPDVVVIKGKYYRKQYCVQINKVYYLLTDPEIIKSAYTGHYILKSSAVELSAVYYGETAIIGRLVELETTTKTHDGEIILVSDKLMVYDLEACEEKIYHKGYIASRRKVPNFVLDFTDKTNPQEDRLRYVPAFSDQSSLLSEFQFYPQGPTALIPTKLIPYFSEMTAKFILPRLFATSEKLRTKINNNFSDLDPQENVAKTFKNIKTNWGGKLMLFNPDDMSPAEGRTFAEMGGLKYSFGVEYETSQGELPTALCDMVKLQKVGDRSIGAAEYVTAPLQGDLGFKRIRAQCEVLNANTLVDDRCSIHVHVGGLTEENSPSFNKQFIINSIKLGALIEAELYSAMPKSRSPFLYHCHSIRRYKDICKSNFDDYLGAYIFGPKELFVNLETGKPITPFPMKDYRLNSERNHHLEVGTWAESRYKWLNMIHTYTPTKHRTIEFRIFSPSTVYEKVKNYVLTALAFTYVADNCTSIIQPGIKLINVFEEAFAKKPEIVSSLSTFYMNRIEKFDRGNIYDHPAIDLKGIHSFLK